MKKPIVFHRLPNHRLAVLAALLLAGFTTSSAQTTNPTGPVYCVPNGAAQACIRASLTTASSGGLTTATLRLSNLEGTALPGITPVAWARLHTVEVVARDDGQFQGGGLQPEAPITLSGAITEYADGPPNWGVTRISEAGEYVGYSVYSDIEKWGAEIVGCTTPPDLAPPYYQTCATDGGEPGDFIIRFTTHGTWEANQVGLVFGIRDDEGETACGVNGSLWTHTELPLCITPRAGGSNQPPTATPGGPYDGTEGSPIVLALGGSDPDAGDVLSYEWNLGDGTTGSGSTPPTSHTYVEDGSYTVSLTVNDGNDGSDTESAAVTVHNVAPGITAIAGPAPVAINVAAGITVSFGDQGTADTHSATIDWGDGTTSHPNVVSGFSASHAYGAAGVYRVDITVTDDDGDAGSRSYEYVVVYDPSAGFVTGGGWFLYESNSCSLTCAGPGRGDFGFVAKYEKGKNAPTGATRFQFHAASLLFESAVYEWLVVAGARAQFKGVGTINGAGDYGFLLTATDGEVAGGGGTDRLRIKIWDTVTGSVVFDNQPDASDDAVLTTALGGGSIVVHVPKK